MINLPTLTESNAVSENVNFLWLELTNQCNLECVHCYAESSPSPLKKDLLTVSHYESVLTASAELGCRNVQFVGGEPTLNKSLPELIFRARSLGYEFIEVFTNLISLPATLLHTFVVHQVRVATSVYSHLPHIHDRITKREGSFNLTMRNIDKVMAAGLSLRVGVIGMPINQDHVEETMDFLRSKGISDLGTDQIREFGRGLQGGENAKLENLCGKCAGSTLCVAPDGTVSPCIMSKEWSIGSILDEPLADIVHSNRLRDLRLQISRSKVTPVVENVPEVNAQCEPHCAPACYPSCVPACAPSCAPSCMPSCAPSCYPSCQPACAPSR